MEMKKNQSDYTDEFREQIAKLAINGKPVMQIQKEYGVTKATIYAWIKKFNNSGSFRDKDNRSKEEIEIKRLQEENKQLRMEVDLLKQAALIMARR